MRWEDVDDRTGLPDSPEVEALLGRYDPVRDGVIDPNLLDDALLYDEDLEDFEEPLELE